MSGGPILICQLIYNTTKGHPRTFHKPQLGPRPHSPAPFYLGELTLQQLSSAFGLRIILFAFPQMIIKGFVL